MVVLILSGFRGIYLDFKKGVVWGKVEFLQSGKGAAWNTLKP